MRKGMIGAGLVMAALFGVATSSIAATVRAGDSLPKTSKRIAVRAGTAQDGDDQVMTTTSGVSTETIGLIGLASLAVIGGVIAVTQGESP